jgi:hypothetical protein
VAVSFIDGGNRSTQRKLPICHKSVTNFITICQFYWWRKSEYPDKTTDLSQVSDKLYHYMSVVLVEEPGVPRENYRPVTSQWQTLSLYVSFIDGGNQSTQRKLPTCHKSVTNFITICQFYWWRKPEYPEKTTNLSQVSDKLYHYMSVLLMEETGVPSENYRPVTSQWQTLSLYGPYSLGAAVIYLMCNEVWHSPNWRCFCNNILYLNRVSYILMCSTKPHKINSIFIFFTSMKYKVMIDHWPVTSHWQTLSHNVVSSTPCHERGSNSQL